MSKKNQDKKEQPEVRPEMQPEEAAPAVPEAAPAPEAEGAEETLPETVTLSREEFCSVRAHIEKLQKEKDDTVQLAQRLQADFDNFRRRNASVHTDSLEEGERNVIKSLLPVLDNFDRALENCGDATGWAEGILLVHKQLLDALHKAGLEEIPASGMFDPELHEAVMQEEVEGAEPGAVTGVLQKGYKVKNRILRHSMVKVAK